MPGGGVEGSIRGVGEAIKRRRDEDVKHKEEKRKPRGGGLEERGRKKEGGMLRVAGEIGRPRVKHAGPPPFNVPTKRIIVITLLNGRDFFFVSSPGTSKVE
jgi:hypothetical protein